MKDDELINNKFKSNQNINSKEWIHDINSGLYWNSLHRIWAKFENQSWSYADEDGNLIDEPCKSNHNQSQSYHQNHHDHPRISKHSKRFKREQITYHDVDDGEEGEVTQTTTRIDSIHSKSKVNDHQNQIESTNDKDLQIENENEIEEEEGELDSLEEALIDFHQSIPAPQPPKPHPIRLVLSSQTRSTALELNKNILILEPDVHEPMVIGRDRTFGPSLRLKEMQISKTHATIFWQTSQQSQSQGWYLVDNASTHGTFVLSSNSNTNAQRLSATKAASKPYRLSHLDCILFASVDDPILAFEVHLHPKFPSSCHTCALFPDESNRMKLESQSLSHHEISKNIQDPEEERYAMSPADVKAERERQRKKKMANLRNQFFGDESQTDLKKNKKREWASSSMGAVEEGDQDSICSSNPNQYLDRAKLRRQTHGASKVTKTPSSHPIDLKPKPQTVQNETMGRGAMMLAKLGGGTEEISKMGKIVEAKTLGNHQAGLGSKEMMIGVEKISEPKDWRQEAKLANWRRYQAL
ncbi:hypothetical protein O181_059287 [Austropuccinia psidii MF-1]|uniref:FHA domain-containing protein n=1 Tax=Austropuccinia psidii MF-1 TaxID=1389203 RepID=A0A9Q3ELD1_9BASI|nr:hypothetical protein [Austropuccinia psidii MF-1]